MYLPHPLPKEKHAQERLQEKRDVEEKLFTAQTRSKSLEQRCQDCVQLVWSGIAASDHGQRWQ